MADIRVQLRGGPEDGHEVTVSADASGNPVPRITLPARVRNAQAVPPQLIYERSTRGADGTWVFDYVGAQP
ncbi:hypothetical protein GCM10011581_24170 [Saccharopolyspora subtropica]|uniref:Uncharacterized protein n=1 Tax=Saccharopolyspora thermophila TaxID=89367 RepID=A0A917NBN1_9PSEU|nr:hypothetical protein [Saccharopolyspora subtropica]GGI86221.1 hypothetical protein GCM10011581_24170 [Saccharopolyspora subtropica]